MHGIRSRPSRWRWLISLSILTVVGLTVQQVDIQAADGALDPTFGSGGKVIVDWNTFDPDSGPKLAVQADGRIIVAPGPTHTLSLIRLFSDGSIDPTFAMVPVPDFGCVDLVIQPDGKIVVLGRHGLMRFNSNGSLDTSFEGGRVSFDIYSSAIAIQSDGKIVVVGSDLVNAFHAIRVDRFNPNGTQDVSFSPLLTNLGASEAVGDDVVIQADGRIVILGRLSVPETDYMGSVLLRCNTDGLLDPSFGNGGVAISNHHGSFPGRRLAPEGSTRVALQGDGRIVVAGPHGTPDMDLKYFLLARYEIDGSLDVSFGDGGVVMSVFGNAQVGRLRALTIQQDGKILVAGGDNQPVSTQFGLMRFTTSGSPDLLFGSFGRVFTPIGEGSFNRWASDLAIQPDGAIVVVGSVLAGDVDKTAVVRYQNRPLAPKFFLHGYASGTAGGLTMSHTAPPPEALQESGKPQSWYSEPMLNGTLVAGATLQFVHPCVAGKAGPMTIWVAMTSEDGRDEQPLGQSAVPGSARCQLRTITIPVLGWTTLANRRLKLTIASSPSAPLKLSIGSGTFLRATNFEGTP